MPQPPEGRYAAVTDMTAPGARLLHRDAKLDGRLKVVEFCASLPGPTRVAHEAGPTG